MIFAKKNIDSKSFSSKMKSKAQAVLMLLVSLTIFLSDGSALTIDFEMDCANEYGISVNSVDDNGRNGFNSGGVWIYHDGVSWLIFVNNQIVFEQVSASSPNPPSNLNWTSYGNQGCSIVPLFVVNGLTEICNNGIDDDGDSFIDCLDSDCSLDASCVDSDGDGVYDIQDYDIDNDGVTNTEESYALVSNTQPDCTNNTSLDFSSIPTLLSGVDLEQGSVYRYYNVSAGLDAIITITELVEATISELDVNTAEDWMFKPELVYDFLYDGQEGYAEFKLQLVNSSSNPAVQERLVMNVNDVDGDVGIKEVCQAKIPQSYTIDVPSDLTMFDDGVWIKGVASPWGESGAGNTYPYLNFNVTYNKKSEITFRVGAISNQNGSLNLYRSHSVEFSCVNNYISPVTYDFDLDDDGINNAYDLDSDNDGIYDVIEVGLQGLDVNNDGRCEGNVGSNGLNDSVESPIDSGAINYTIKDSDGDGIKDYFEKDSDNDGCNDVNEAGYPDSNGDGVLGGVPLTIDNNGKVSYTP